MFRKGKEEELRLADQLKDQLRRTREAFAGNFDKKDPKFTTLFEELKRLFQKKKLDEVSQEEMERNIHALEALFVKIVDLNKLNQLLKQKYAYDEKFARVHKRIQEQEQSHQSNVALTNLLKAIKAKTDEKVLNNQGILGKEAYFQQTVQHLVIGCIKDMQLELENDLVRFIAKSIAKEYLEEFEGVA
jgi:type I restriction enzyme R subunit